MTKPVPAPAAIAARNPFGHLIERLYGYDVFISYTRMDDEQSAYPLALQATLTQGSEKERRPPMRCFLDLRDLPHDDELRRAIEAKVRASRHVVFIAGPSAADHPWMCFEAEMARKHRRPMIVLDRGIDWVNSKGKLRELVDNVLAIPSAPGQAQPGTEVEKLSSTIGSFRVSKLRRRI